LGLIDHEDEMAINEAQQYGHRTHVSLCMTYKQSRLSEGEGSGKKRRNLMPGC